MSSNTPPISNVTTNIITGFLGVGKTTAIINLLHQRPPDEHWSVLVNEFGEMGIDGYLMENNDSSIFIKQVPGGCICCAAGLPLQVVVNQLLKQTRPDRLIIEPSGMGHPRNILKSLSEKHYQGVLDMRACVCLVDPRKLNDKRYLESELFVDQIDVADIVIANKTDLCGTGQKEKFEQYILHVDQHKQTKWVENGRIELQWLNLKCRESKPEKSAAKTTKLTDTFESQFNKLTFNYTPDIKFNLKSITAFLSSLNAERIKGVLNTDEGFIIINHAGGDFRTEFVARLATNRIEIISIEKFNQTTLANKLKEFCSV